MTRSPKNQTRTSPCVLKAVLLLFVLAVMPPAGADAGPPAKPRLTISDLTVKDNITGLVWTRNGNLAGEMLSWYDAFQFIRMLNEKRYAGHSDWKLPDIYELKKLVTAVLDVQAAGSGKSDVSVSAALIRSGFLDVQAGDYWSSTTNMFNEVEAGFISMISGDNSHGNKALYMNVWPVRWEGRIKVPAPGNPSAVDGHVKERDRK